MFRFRNRFTGRHSTNSRNTDSNVLLPLTEMRNGQQGIVAEVNGGQGTINRLTSLGIRRGQKVTRIGGLFLRGPVTVQLDKGQVAIGFRMASKILVKAFYENPADG